MPSLFLPSNCRQSNVRRMASSLRLVLVWAAGLSTLAGTDFLAQSNPLVNEGSTPLPVAKVLNPILALLEIDMPHVWSKLFLFVMFGSWAVLPIHAQTSSVSSAEAMDAGITRPVITGVLGRVDADALKEVTVHLAATGAAPWKGMQGTGVIVYAQEKTSYPATLSMLGTDRFRLDAQTSKGETSIRINGLVGKIGGPGGTPFTMPPDTAAAGIFPFQMVRAAHFPGKRTTLVDHEPVTANGTQLHRISVERPTIGSNPATKSAQTIAIDFYFDPLTNLLVKSASFQAAADGHSASFLRVVTYSDYRRVGTSMIPFHYSESMDGELYWTLRLTDVQLNPTFDTTYFQF